MGTVSRAHLRFRACVYPCQRFIHPFGVALFPDFGSILYKELSDCDSFLDLGCGHSSPIESVDVPYSVGVELSSTYLGETQRLGLHSDYVRADIRHVEFKADSFDVVIALNVFEYLTKREGIELLEKMKGWARRRVVIRTPNGQVDRHQLNSEYKSTWEPNEFEARGCKVRGSEGWKKVNVTNKGLRELLTNVTQRITYFFPKQAGSLLVSYQIDSVRRPKNPA